jgi:hypothetical protein
VTPDATVMRCAGLEKPDEGSRYNKNMAISVLGE